MLRHFRFLLPLLAAFAGLVMVPAGGIARGYQGGWDIYAPERAAPRYERRKVLNQRKALLQRKALHKRKALQQRKVLARKAAKQRSAWAQRQIARSHGAHKITGQRAATTRVNVQRRVSRFGYGPEEQARRPARRVAALGDAHFSRLADLRPAGRVEARVDIRSQRMVVRVDGEVRHIWKVSTGRSGFATPRGTYGPQRMHARYFSKKYYNSPMPYSIFFRGGYAVHGTNDLKRLGGPASHGCVRLAVPHAQALFQLVKAYGPGRSRIVIG